MIDETDVYAILLKRIDNAENDKLREKYDVAMSFVSLALDEDDNERKKKYLQLAYYSVPAQDIVVRSMLAEFMLRFE